MNPEDQNSEALTSPDYISGASAIDQQAGLNEQTYGQTRQRAIDSYQRTLDSINYGMKQAGIQARGQYADRNLYNAGGDLSGTGTMVGQDLLQPSINSLTDLQRSHETNLQSLSTAEAQGRLDTANSKTKLLNDVINNIAAAKKAESDAAMEAAKLPGGQIDVRKVRTDQQIKGRQYIGSPKQATELARKYGSDSILKIGGDLFLLSAKERADLAKARRVPGTNTTATTSYNQELAQASSSVSANGEPGKKTREQLITELSTKYTKKSRAQIARDVYSAYPDNGKTGTDPQIRNDLVSDIREGASLDELYTAYPELSATEIQSIYNSL